MGGSAGNQSPESAPHPQVAQSIQDRKYHRGWLLDPIEPQERPFSVKLGHRFPAAVEKLQSMPHAIVAAFIWAVPAKKSEVPRALDTEVFLHRGRRAVDAQTLLQACLVRCTLIARRSGSKAQEGRNYDHGDLNIETPR